MLKRSYHVTNPTESVKVIKEIYEVVPTVATSFSAI